MSAAVAGRVLLTTLHSRDCVGAVTALRSWQLDDHEIAESLSIVVAQRLVRRRCIHCGERKPLTERQAGWFREKLLIEHGVEISAGPIQQGRSPIWTFLLGFGPAAPDHVLCLDWACQAAGGRHGGNDGNRSQPSPTL